jgi:hypothetical protein
VVAKAGLSRTRVAGKPLARDARQGFRTDRFRPNRLAEASAWSTADAARWMREAPFVRTTDAFPDTTDAVRCSTAIAARRVAAGRRIADG